MTCPLTIYSLPGMSDAREDVQFTWQLLYTPGLYIECEGNPFGDDPSGH